MARSNKIIISATLAALFTISVPASAANFFSFLFKPKVYKVNRYNKFEKAAVNEAASAAFYLYQRLELTHDFQDLLTDRSISNDDKINALLKMSDTQNSLRRKYKNRSYSLRLDLVSKYAIRRAASLVASIDNSEVVKTKDLIEALLKLFIPKKNKRYHEKVYVLLESLLSKLNKDKFLAFSRLTEATSYDSILKIYNMGNKTPNINPAALFEALGVVEAYARTNNFNATSKKAKKYDLAYRNLLLVTTAENQRLNAQITDENYDNINVIIKDILENQLLASKIKLDLLDYLSNSKEDPSNSTLEISEEFLRKTFYQNNDKEIINSNESAVKSAKEKLKSLGAFEDIN
jgi:hypothetical protein